MANRAQAANCRVGSASVAIRVNIRHGRLNIFQSSPTRTDHRDLSFSEPRLTDYREPSESPCANHPRYFYPRNAQRPRLIRPPRGTCSDNENGTIPLSPSKFAAEIVSTTADPRNLDQPRFRSDTIRDEGRPKVDLPTRSASRKPPVGITGRKGQPTNAGNTRFHLGLCLPSALARAKPFNGRADDELRSSISSTARRSPTFLAFRSFLSPATHRLGKFPLGRKRGREEEGGSCPREGAREEIRI